jgi:hypothetical protein
MSLILIRNIVGTVVTEVCVAADSETLILFVVLILVVVLLLLKLSLLCINIKNIAY